MSLIGSLLSLVLIPLKAKPEARPKEVENLAALALAKEVKCLQFALDHWRDSGHALWEENQRLRQELRGVRDDRDLVRAELRELMVQKDPTSPYYRHGGFGQEQANVLMAQQAYYQGLYQRHALGQQSQNPFSHCNCVPSRAQALNRDQAE
jgi:hypothetical protein